MGRNDKNGDNIMAMDGIIEVSNNYWGTNNWLDIVPTLGGRVMPLGLDGLFSWDRGGRWPGFESYYTMVLRPVDEATATVGEPFQYALKMVLNGTDDSSTAFRLPYLNATVHDVHGVHSYADARGTTFNFVPTETGEYTTRARLYNSEAVLDFTANLPVPPEPPVIIEVPKEVEVVRPTPANIQLVSRSNIPVRRNNVHAFTKTFRYRNLGETAGQRTFNIRISNSNAYRLFGAIKTTGGLTYNISGRTIQVTTNLAPGAQGAIRFRIRR
jgi:hypothetical protein